MAFSREPTKVTTRTTTTTTRTKSSSSSSSSQQQEKQQEKQQRSFLHPGPQRQNATDQMVVDAETHVISNNNNKDKQKNKKNRPTVKLEDEAPSSPTGSVPTTVGLEQPLTPPPPAVSEDHPSTLVVEGILGVSDTSESVSSSIVSHSDPLPSHQEANTDAASATLRSPEAHRDTTSPSPGLFSMVKDAVSQWNGDKKEEGLDSLDQPNACTDEIQTTKDAETPDGTETVEEAPTEIVNVETPEPETPEFQSETAKSQSAETTVATKGKSPPGRTILPCPLDPLFVVTDTSAADRSFRPSLSSVKQQMLDYEGAAKNHRDATDRFKTAAHVMSTHKNKMMNRRDSPPWLAQHAAASERGMTPSLTKSRDLRSMQNRPPPPPPAGLSPPSPPLDGVGDSSSSPGKPVSSVMLTKSSSPSSPPPSSIHRGEGDDDRSGQKTMRTTITTTDLPSISQPSSPTVSSSSDGNRIMKRLERNMMLTKSSPTSSSSDRQVPGSSVKSVSTSSSSRPSSVPKIHRHEDDDDSSTIKKPSRRQHFNDYMAFYHKSFPSFGTRHSAGTAFLSKDALTDKEPQDRTKNTRKESGPSQTAMPRPPLSTIEATNVANAVAATRKTRAPSTTGVPPPLSKALALRAAEFMAAAPADKEAGPRAMRRSSQSPSFDPIVSRRATATKAGTATPSKAAPSKAAPKVMRSFKRPPAMSPPEATKGSRSSHGNSRLKPFSEVVLTSSTPASSPSSRLASAEAAPLGSNIPGGAPSSSSSRASSHDEDASRRRLPLGIFGALRAPSFTARRSAIGSTVAVESLLRKNGKPARAETQKAFGVGHSAASAANAKHAPRLFHPPSQILQTSANTRSSNNGITLVTTWKRQDTGNTNEGILKKGGMIEDKRSRSLRIFVLSRGLLLFFAQRLRSLVTLPFVCTISLLRLRRQRIEHLQDDNPNDNRTSKNVSRPSTTTLAASPVRSEGSTSSSKNTNDDASSCCYHWKRRSFLGSTALRLSSIPRQKERKIGFRYPTTPPTT